VKDGFGNGVPGITVSWSVDSGSGSVVQPTSITDANGRAGASITAGDTIGALTIRATITQLPADTAFFGLAVVAAPTIVAIGNNFFNPNALIISPGTSVKWVWNAGTHTVSQLDGPEISMSSQAQSAGATFGPILFTTLGVYHYECTIHSNMLGSISVE
jgi:plastocyanin